VANGGAAGGDELPAVAGGAEYVAGCSELHGGGVPADVGYVCASGADFAVVPWVEDVGGEVCVDVAFPVGELGLLEGVDLVLLGEGFGDVGGELEFLGGVGGCSDLAHVCGDDFAEGSAGYLVVASAVHVDLEGGFGH